MYERFIYCLKYVVYYYLLVRRVECHQSVTKMAAARSTVTLSIFPFSIHVFDLEENFLRLNRTKVEIETLPSFN